MNIFHRQLARDKKLIILSSFILATLFIAWSISTVSAQASSPQITSINVASVASTSATITFTTDDPASGRIAYDTVAHANVSNYASITPADVPSTNHSRTINGLTDSTTFHFRIEVTNPNGTTASADRTFTTRTTGGAGIPLTITNPIANCASNSCDLQFTTSRAAQVQIRWDTSTHLDFFAYPGSVKEPGPGYVSGTRSLPLAGLAANTTYLYRMQAIGELATGGDTITTGDLTFTTPNIGKDHIFTTGACTDGTALGACTAAGLFCPTTGGNPLQDCSKCGFSCSSLRGAPSTCSVGGGSCILDPALNGSPSQCNNSSCYQSSGIFINPAAVGCYASWPRCNANTILKVKKDRGCNLWLTCSTSLQTEPTTDVPAENLCLSLAACNSLNAQGQCNKYLPQGQCNNDPLRFCSTNFDCQAGGTCSNPAPNQPTKNLRDLTFTTPDQISKIANLSGNVIAGLDWAQQGGSTFIQGALPWQLMRQIGGDGKIENGDFEDNPPALGGWDPSPATTKLAINLEDKDNKTTSNHILYVQPDPAVAFSGAVSNDFSASSSEYYYAEARIKSKLGSPKVRLQLGFQGYTKFQATCNGVAANTFTDVTGTGAWQRVTIGPFCGLSGTTKVGVVCANLPDCAAFEVDDVQVKPILQINTNPDYITPSCRLFPKNDAPACDYTDPNGVKYKGWHGYCLEHDSQTGTCLSWWPVDVIRGESNIFGTEQGAGYNDRVPLFMCVESAGRWNSPDPVTGETTYPGKACDTDPKNGGINLCGLPLNQYQVMTSHVVQPGLGGFDGDEQCGDIENRGECRDGSQRGFCTCADPGYSGSFPAVGADADIHKYDIEYFRVVTERITTRWADPSVNLPKQMIIGPENEQPDGSWLLSLNLGGCDSLEIRLRWDSTTQKLLGYDLKTQVCTARSNNEGGFTGTGLFAMREQCSKVAEVVKPGVPPITYARRVSSGEYIVDSLGYVKTQDFTPYGGALQPSDRNSVQGDEPTTWNIPLHAEVPDTLGITGNFSSPYQSRSGSPYACKGNCNRVCSTVGPTDAPVTCTADQDCKGLTPSNGTVLPAAYDDLGANIAIKGRCIGALPIASAKGTQKFGAHDSTLVGDNNFFAQERIRRLFVKSFGLWSALRCSNTGLVCNSNLECGTGQCNVAASTYQPLPSLLNWSPPTGLCPADPADSTKLKRPLFPNDYCAIPPRVFCPDQGICDKYAGVKGHAQFLIGTASNATISGGSGSVGIKFNTDADPEQVPLQTIAIDWGDSVTADVIAFPFSPRNDPAKPHIFSHVYVSSGSREFKIRIQVKDNWDWCNDPANTPVNNNCSEIKDNWLDTGLRVRVQP